TTSAVTITPITLTDETGYPGDFCIYTGSDLLIDATHLCQQRTSGAQNWEAWIKDTRDDELYRIVLMPDNKWWLAQNVKLASYNGSTIGSAVSGCNKEQCGRAYAYAEAYASYAGGTSASTGNVQGICPPGWLLPITNDFQQLVASIGSNALVCERIRSLDSNCSPRPDYYGYANVKHVHNGTIVYQDGWYTNDSGREDGMNIDGKLGVWKCGYIEYGAGADGAQASVRCFRQL
ncbi:MAG: hypothetical protein LBU42_01265, partial [Prevotellaceae bacterium]|nr:hypothetical protein [Prevotellaceae bacterium]